MGIPVLFTAPILSLFAAKGPPSCHKEYVRPILDDASFGLQRACILLYYTRQKHQRIILNLIDMVTFCKFAVL